MSPIPSHPINFRRCDLCTGPHGCLLFIESSTDHALQQLNEQEQKAFQMYGKLPQKNLLSKINKVSTLSVSRCAYGRRARACYEPAACAPLAACHFWTSFCLAFSDEPTMHRAVMMG